MSQRRRKSPAELPHGIFTPKRNHMLDNVISKLKNKIVIQETTNLVLSETDKPAKKNDNNKKFSKKVRKRRKPSFEIKELSDNTLKKSYLMWDNNSNLCWLDAAMALLVHNKLLHTRLSDAKSTQINKIVNAYDRAISLLNSEAGDIDKRMVEAQDILQKIQISTLKFLQPLLKNKEGQPDSAFCSLYNLINQEQRIRELYEADFFTVLTCKICSARHVKQHKKPVATFSKVKEFIPEAPVSLCVCPVCKASDQDMVLHYKTLPQCFVFHFESSSNEDELQYFEFAIGERQYQLSGLITLEKGQESNMNHFVTWIRDSFSSTWLECNDLNSDIVSFSMIPPFLCMSNIHILLYEASDAAGTVQNPNFDAKYNDLVKDSEATDRKYNIPVVDLLDESDFSDIKEFTATCNKVVEEKVDNDSESHCSIENQDLIIDLKSSDLDSSDSKIPQKKADSLDNKFQGENQNHKSHMCEEKVTDCINSSEIKVLDQSATKGEDSIKKCKNKKISKQKQKKSVAPPVLNCYPTNCVTENSNCSLCDNDSNLNAFDCSNRWIKRTNDDINFASPMMLKLPIHSDSLKPTDMPTDEFKQMKKLGNILSDTKKTGFSIAISQNNILSSKNSVNTSSESPTTILKDKTIKNQPKPRMKQKANLTESFTAHSNLNSSNDVQKIDDTDEKNKKLKFNLHKKAKQSPPEQSNISQLKYNNKVMKNIQKFDNNKRQRAIKNSKGIKIRSKTKVELETKLTNSSIFNNLKNGNIQEVKQTNKQNDQISTSAPIYDYKCTPFVKKPKLKKIKLSPVEDKTRKMDSENIINKSLNEEWKNAENQPKTNVEIGAKLANSSTPKRKKISPVKPCIIDTANKNISESNIHLKQIPSSTFSDDLNNEIIIPPFKEDSFTKDDLIINCPNPLVNISTGFVVSKLPQHFDKERINSTNPTIKQSLLSKPPHQVDKQVVECPNPLIKIPPAFKVSEISQPQHVDKKVINFPNASITISPKNILETLPPHTSPALECLNPLLEVSSDAVVTGPSKSFDNQEKNSMNPSVKVSPHYEQSNKIPVLNSSIKVSPSPIVTESSQSIQKPSVNKKHCFVVSETSQKQPVHSLKVSHGSIVSESSHSQPIQNASAKISPSFIVSESLQEHIPSIEVSPGFIVSTPSKLQPVPKHSVKIGVSEPSQTQHVSPKKSNSTKPRDTQKIKESFEKLEASTVEPNETMSNRNSGNSIFCDGRHCHEHLDAMSLIHETVTNIFPMYYNFYSKGF